MKKPYLETGEIVGTHGIAGEMRVMPWSDSPETLAKIKTLYLDAEGTKTIDITRARVHKSLVLITVKGVDSIEKAERLRGKVLFVDRKDLNIQDGGHFIQDLLGCKVYDADTGKLYGVLSEVSATGANDVWHITPEGEKKEYLIPAIPDVVISIDIDSEKIEIRPLKGIFDDED